MGSSEETIVISFDIGIKNLAGCIFSLGPKGSKTAKIYKWHVWSLAAEKEKIPSIHELTHRLIDVLDEIVADLEHEHGIKKIHQVLLENQPSRLNGAMKSMQMIIYSYFQLRSHWDGLVDKTQMVSASQKLQGHDYIISAPPTQGVRGGAQKTGYALNKWKGIEYAKLYISGDPGLVELFNGHKKKDDLADSMLQGLTWGRKQGWPELSFACGIHVEQQSPDEVEILT